MTDLLEQDVVPPSTSYREISLTRGRSVLVDADDFVFLNQWKWHSLNSGTRFYAARNAKRGTSPRVILMHRIITNCRDGMDVDHKNGNTLDNRRSNLRNVSRSQNNMNRGVVVSKCGRKGVTALPNGRFLAQIKINRRTKYLGKFGDIDSAAEAYTKAARELFGEFTRA